MQSEWPPHDQDAVGAPVSAHRAVLPQAAGFPDTTDPGTGDGTGDARSDVGAGPAVVEAVGPPEPADRTEPADDEEWHRSAVDAVDGLLDEVERALTRLDDGTYGRCEDCGETIDDERLAALPVVRNCGGCDGSHGGPGTRQPVEPASA